MPEKKIEATDIHVGSRLKMRRRMLGMSQSDIADAVGLTFQQIQKYENGKNRIGSSRLQQFSNILQVPVAFFFDGLPDASKGEAGIPPDVVEFFATAEGLKIAHTFRKIKKPKTRRQIVELVEAIASEM